MKLALALGLALAAFGALAQNARAACPPPLQPPSAEQLQAAQQQARDRGALWKLTRDGRSSYLFGTIHVGKLEWAMPGPQLREALRATDVLALEIDPTDAAMRARIASPPAGSVPSTISDAHKRRLARGLDAACLPRAVRPAIEGQHPVLQTMTLAVLEARWEGLDAGYAQEFALAGFARAAERRIVSLETPEQQLDALMPRTAAELQQAVGSALDQLEKGTVRRTIARLAAAWERGDLDEMAAYERWCECVLDDNDRRQLVRLLDERNPGLADRIEALHRDGARVFAGVGALHMVGPKALPALLRAKGFQVERVAFQ
ncbi:MAG TPA: TraB/GumN family protein [Burkholderiaceae bacterium]|nr:TraB/GumN family protein [Burkholderiaceae bacterium]